MSGLKLDGDECYLCTGEDLTFLETQSQVYLPY